VLLFGAQQRPRVVGLAEGDRFHRARPLANDELQMFPVAADGPRRARQLQPAAGELRRGSADAEGPETEDRLDDRHAQVGTETPDTCVRRVL